MNEFGLNGGPMNGFPPAGPSPGGSTGGWVSHLQFVFGPGGLSGSRTGGVILPDPGDVRFGIVYDANNLPAPKDVRLGVVYG